MQSMQIHCQPVGFSVCTFNALEQEPIGGVPTDISLVTVLSRTTRWVYLVPSIVFYLRMLSSDGSSLATWRDVIQSSSLSNVCKTFGDLRQIYTVAFMILKVLLRYHMLIKPVSVFPVMHIPRMTSSEDSSAILLLGSCIWDGNTKFLETVHFSFKRKFPNLTSLPCSWPQKRW